MDKALEYVWRVWVEPEDFLDGATAGELVFVAKVEQRRIAAERIH